MEIFMSLPPKGKGRKSNIEAYRDAIAIVKLVDHDCMEVADAAKALGLKERTAYRLLSRARSMLLTPQIEADKKAAEPKVKDWFEPMSGGDDIAASDASADANVVRVTDDAGHHEGSPVQEFKLPDVQPEPSGETDKSCVSSIPVPDPEFIVLPDGTKRRIRPQQPTEDIYQWSHLMDYSSFRVKTPWRQK